MLAGLVALGLIAAAPWMPWFDWSYREGGGPAVVVYSAPLWEPAGPVPYASVDLPDDQWSVVALSAALYATLVVVNVALWAVPAFWALAARLNARRAALVVTAAGAILCLAIAFAAGLDTYLAQQIGSAVRSTRVVQGELVRARGQGPLILSVATTQQVLAFVWALGILRADGDGKR